MSAKRAAIVIRVNGRHVEFPYKPTDIRNRQWLLILGVILYGS